MRDPAVWPTWLLSSADELRPAAPAAPTRSEVEELLHLQEQRTAVMKEAVARWSTGPAVLPWTELALGLIVANRPSPVRAGRALALLHVAISDAVVATWDAQSAYGRPGPSLIEPGIQPLGPVEASNWSFPSEHAAVAGAASTVLSYLFPRESAEGLTALAQEAMNSRVWGGANYRSDVEVGFALGQAVGERALARGQTDGSDAHWDGSDRPTGAGTWEPTPPGFVREPLDPLAGSWRTWVIEDVRQVRPPAPPTYGSLEWEAELAAVREAVVGRTPEQSAAVHYWAGGAGTMTPAGLWVEIARDLIVRDGLDLLHAARVLALTSVAIADAFICCWDAKYAYWTARPITADPSLDVLIPTPPFPSYTSGHSTISAAAATVLGRLFPADAADLAARAVEVKNSRLWAGIHFPIDNEIGAEAGALVGRLVAGLAQAVGAE